MKSKKKSKKLLPKYYDDFTEEYHVDSCPVWIDSQLNCQCEQLEIFTRNRTLRGNDD